MPAALVIASKIFAAVALVGALILVILLGVSGSAQVVHIGQVLLYCGLIGFFGFYLAVNIPA